MVELITDMEILQRIRDNSIEQVDLLKEVKDNLIDINRSLMFLNRKNKETGRFKGATLTLEDFEYRIEPKDNVEIKVLINGQDVTNKCTEVIMVSSPEDFNKKK